MIQSAGGLECLDDFRDKKRIGNEEIQVFHRVNVYFCQASPSSQNK